MFDTIIKSSRVITGGQVQNAFVAVRGGVIEAVWQQLPEGTGQPVTDIGDTVLMPGVVDTHVHINEPGRTHWEGFDTATSAAAAGGVTTLVDMPLNSFPVTTTVAAFEQKLACARNNIRVNCGFWAGLVPGNEGEIEALADRGVLGFKAFLAHSGIDEFPNVTEAHLHRAMPLIAKRGLPLLVHAELPASLPYTPAAPSASYANYLSSRPKSWEDNAIAMMIRLCAQYGCRVHIVHLSSSGSIAQIAEARAKGLPLTVETAQHYLGFHAEAIADGQTQFKCAPPIREKENNDRLWDALRAGIIDFVATDHSPAPPALKKMDSGDFMQAWGGIASLQFALPALWTAGQPHQASLPQMAGWLCEKPATLLGTNFKKGKIQEGYDADLVAWNPEASFTVTADMILHRHKTTPYLHQRLSGRVERTWLKGAEVYNRSTGRYLNEDIKKGEVLLSEPGSTEFY